MGWKKLNNNDAGSNARFGGMDVDKISDLFAGVDVDDILIGSDWGFKDDKLYILSTDLVHKYIVSSSGITVDRTVTLPLLLANDTFLFNSNSATVSNKTFDTTNKYTGVFKFPSLASCGKAPCCHTTEVGEGLLYGYTKVGTPTLQVTSLGTSLQYSTGATANTSVGSKTPSAIFRRDLNTRMKWSVSFDSTANSRFYAGFINNATLPGTDTPIAAGEHGFIAGWRSTDTNIMLFTNDATGVNVVDSGVSKSAANPVIIELKLDSTGLVSYSINNGSVNTIITKLPGLTTNMYGHVIGQNTTTTPRVVDERYWEVEQDK